MDIALAALSAAGGGLLIWQLLRVLSGPDTGMAPIVVNVVVAVLLLLLAGVLLVVGLA
jgi:hypothetical protein